jgi:zinc protease
MGFLLNAVTQEKFEVQRSTVKNEKQQNLNQQYGLVFETLGQTLYPEGHKYNWPIIGYTDDLDRADVTDLKNFFMRWYGPNNATLVVAGDVDTKAVVALVEKYFGSIKKGPAVRRIKKDMPILTADKYANIEDLVGLPLTFMAFPVPHLYHRDEPALDLLSSLMGQGNNSLFYQNMVKTDKAVQASTFSQMSEINGMFGVQVVAYPGESLNDTEQLIRKTIEEFGTKGVSAEDLERVKSDMISGFYDIANSVQSKASVLTSWELYSPRKMNLQQEIDRYKKVTKEDVMAVYNKYIKGKKAAIVNCTPIPYEDRADLEDDFKKSFNPYAGREFPTEAQYEGLTYERSTDIFDRSKKPVPGAAKAVTVPKYVRKKLDNGIDMILTQSNESPKVTILLSIKGGHLLESVKDENFGLASLTADLMNEGTKNYTTEQISAALDKLGSSVSFYAGGSSTDIYVSTFKDKLAETITLLEEKLLNPGFNEEDFTRVKKQTLENIKNQKDNASFMASTVFRKLIYGNSILGEPTTGSYTSVDDLKLKDVQSFYEDNYSPKATSIVVVGDITADEAITSLEFLNKWTGKEVVMPVIDNLPDYEATGIYLVNKPQASQSQVYIGHKSNKHDVAGDFYKSGIMNYALGGAFNSRINLNLREDKGWTYGARSQFSGGSTDYNSFYVATGSIKANATDSAIVEFMKEIKNYRENGITDEELSFTKNSIIQRDALKYETPFQKAGFLSDIVEKDLPADFQEQRMNVLNNITKEEINKLAKEQLHPDKMVIMVVGNAYTLKDRLGNIGYGKVTELEMGNVKLKEFKN